MDRRRYAVPLAIVIIAGVGIAAIFDHLRSTSLKATQGALWAYEDIVRAQADMSRATPAETIFIGDSQVAHFPESMLPPHSAKYGILGDTIDGLMIRTPTLNLANSKTIMVEVGVNNWLRDRHVGFGGKYGRLLASLPLSAKVIATAIFPVNAGAGRYFDVPAISKSIRVANREIEVACRARPLCQFLDLTPILADRSGALRPEYTVDGLHLSSTGYQAWAAELRQRIANDTR